jgi:indolepyruvate ferredoxin oxidoreductase, alpha subunit
MSMGASPGIIKGISKAMTCCNTGEPIVSVIGDGTFFHSGLPGFINLLHQKGENENITIIILDNRTTAMTGGQHNASSGAYNEIDDLKIDIKKLLNTVGFDRVREVDQFEYKAAQQAIKEEIEYNGVSIIIANRPCALKYLANVRKPYFHVEPETCIGCRTCIRTNCPPLGMKKYEGIEKLKSSIDKEMCVGCSICAQVCPVNAIKQSGEVPKEE